MEGTCRDLLWGNLQVFFSWTEENQEILSQSSRSPPEIRNVDLLSVKQECYPLHCDIEVFVSILLKL
jgi:hypothetical protein